LKRRRNKEWLLLIISGFLLGISFPPVPFPFTLLIFIGFIPYFLVLKNRESLASINRATFLMNFVFSLITVYWVGSWQSEADPFLMAGGAALLLALPCVLLIPSTLFYMLKKIFPKINPFYLFPLFWVTAEYLLTLTDLRFPWITLGQGLAKFTLFIQGAEIIGTFGLSLVVIYVNVFLFQSYRKFKEENKNFRLSFVLGLFLFFIFLIYGIVRVNTFELSDRKVKVGLIQPDLNPWDKWETGNLTELVDLYLTLSEDAVNKGAEIIFWPETALPVYAFGGSYTNITDSIHNFLDKNNVTLITGMPDIKYFYDKNNIPDDAKFNDASDLFYATYNAVLMLTPQSREIQRYGKMKLVPMGELVPFSNQIKFLGEVFKWGVGISVWNVGQDTTVFKVALNNSSDTISISGLVCYESVFPVFVPHFIQRGAEMISVVTNDSWYGKSSGPYQHKDFAILRAVENRRSVVRCANGGVSCIINAKGQIESETELFTKSVLVGDVTLQNEMTFYSRNPAIVPVLSSVFSFWIFGMNVLIWMKKKFKL
jgi:apolipoprotein N-acyltransferase